MSKLFNQNLNARPGRTAFDLSHERKLSMRMGHLVPVFVQEVVPGDKFNIDTQSMIRFAPLVAPVMHRMNAYIHYFYVPNRILWDGWEKFVTGDGSTVPECRLDAYNVEEGNLAEHLGIPLGNFAGSQKTVSRLPWYAYYQIYNDYYRDENLANGGQEIDYANLDDGWLLNAYPQKRAWEKDYFTSALPWAQKGNPVTMDASINYRSKAIFENFTGGDITPGDAQIVQSAAQGQGNITSGNNIPMLIDNINSVSVSVEELRRATRLQRWLERNARSGTRYVEHLLAHWGVKSSDARLQRAEYIGGGKSPIVISEVLNTTGTADAPQGQMAGHGISVGRTNHATKYCEEHGFIMGIMSIIPEATYQQGLPKMFTRLLNLDYYYPEFAQLGEQPVLNSELYLSATDADNDKTFGYQSRFAEYKYAQSTVHGQFKTTLDHWHLGRKFSALPVLNDSFVTVTPDNRIFAVEEDNENMYVQLYHKVTAVRPMPFFNDPKL